MTSTPSEPRLYDVWLMWVEFPDHPGIGKPRPVVITEVAGDLVSGIVAKITGNTDWDEAGDVPLLDWKAEGLLKPSLVRCSQRFYFNRSELLQWFGRLSLRDAEHVNDGLKPVVPERLRTLDHGRPWRDDQFAACRVSSSRDMSR